MYKTAALYIYKERQVNLRNIIWWWVIINIFFFFSTYPAGDYCKHGHTRIFKEKVDSCIFGKKYTWQETSTLAPTA